MVIRVELHNHPQHEATQKREKLHPLQDEGIMRSAIGGERHSRYKIRIVWEKEKKEKKVSTVADRPCQPSPAKSDLVHYRVKKRRSSRLHNQSIDYPYL